MEEIWKEIVWNGIRLYASNMGRIKDAKGRIKRQNQSFKYNRVSIGNKCELVHRIIASAFIPNPENLETVNHIDENKRNNAASNLEWCTRQENSLKKFGRSGCFFVEQKTPSGEIVTVFNSQREAALVTGIHREAINMCCSGRRKYAGGFCWSYTKIE